MPDVIPAVVGTTAALLVILAPFAVIKIAIMVGHKLVDVVRGR